MPRTIGNANDLIELQLDQRIEALEDSFSSHVIAFCGGIYFGVDDLLRSTVEKKCQLKPLRRKLVMVLTTSGGFIEVVQRIVGTLRRHYRVVEFVVPNHAYSAGTVLVMSGDAIHMDYYSRLGPIDPQVSTPTGRSVPALGYLERYKTLIDKAKRGEITEAEVQLLISGFDQAELYQYEHARELSIALLKEWLVKYKFKTWKITKTRKLTVTKKMKEDRAKEIAQELNNTERWHYHGYGISMEVLRRDLKVEIDDFSADDNKALLVRGYHDLLSDYMAKRGAKGVIHIKGDYRPFM